MAARARIPQQRVMLVIDGARVIDGTGAQPLEQARVVIDGERIVSVGPQSSVGIPADAEIVDAAGKTLLPGLIDVHVHDLSDANMALYLRTGVTSIRFAGGFQPDILRLRGRIERGELSGPRIFSCGGLLDATPHAWPSLAVDTPIEARRVVRRAIESDRVDAVLAAHAVAPSVLTAIVETAHQFAIPVTGQIWRSGAADAIAAGIDGLDNTSRIPDHPSFPPERLFAQWSVSGRIATLNALWAAADPARLAEIAATLAEHGVTLAPELVSFEAWAGLSRDEIAGDPDWPDAEDPLVRAYDRHNAFIASEWTPEDVTLQARAVDTFKEFCRVFHSRGGALAAGTDLTLGGLLLHRELAHFVDAGLTPLQAIRTATRAAASFLARDDLGFLGAGRAADVIVVNGDPSRDLAALRRVERTIVAGRTVWQRAVQFVTNA